MPKRGGCPEASTLYRLAPEHPVCLPSARGGSRASQSVGVAGRSPPAFPGRRAGGPTRQRPARQFGPETAEQATSSVSTKSGWTADLGVWPFPGQGVGRCWCGGVQAAAFHKIVSQISPKARVAPGWAGIPSRKLRSAGPHPACPGGAPRRTYDLDQPDAVWLPPVHDGSRCSAGCEECGPSRRNVSYFLDVALDGAGAVGRSESVADRVVGAFRPSANEWPAECRCGSTSPKHPRSHR